MNEDILRVRARYQLLGQIGEQVYERIAHELLVDGNTQALMDAVSSQLQTGGVTRLVNTSDYNTDWLIDWPAPVMGLEVQQWASGKVPIPDWVVRVLLRNLLVDVVNGNDHYGFSDDLDDTDTAEGDTL